MERYVDRSSAETSGSVFVAVFDSVPGIPIVGRIFGGMWIYCMNIAQGTFLFQRVSVAIGAFSDKMFHQ